MKRIPIEERYETLKVERNGRLLTITMNRPDFLNASDKVMHEELAEVFYDVASDRDSDVVVFTGSYEVGKLIQKQAANEAHKFIASEMGEGRRPPQIWAGLEERVRTYRIID